MSDQFSSGRKSTSLVISRAIAVVFSRMSFRMRCLVLHVSLPEVYDKTAEINGFTVLQLCWKIYDCVRPSMAERYGLTSNHWIVCSCMSACKTFFIG